MQSVKEPIQTIGNVINPRDIPEGILPANTVFIGTGTPWENPYKMSIHGNREQVVSQYEVMLANDPNKLHKLDDLTGKDLVCHEAPYVNHGDLLADLAALSYADRLVWAESIMNSETAKLAA